jgi:hypothetical protein
MWVQNLTGRQGKSFSVAAFLVIGETKLSNESEREPESIGSLNREERV